MLLLSRIPILPIINSLSTVENLPVLNKDIFFKPFTEDGINSISSSSFHWNCVVIKQTVTSVSVEIKTNAGRNLLPDKSEKGKGIRTISPFFTCTFLLNH